MRILEGDCRELLRTLAPDSLDSCVTDPPYALVSVVKRFGSPTAAPAKGNDAYMRASAGFMGKQWDTGECAMSADFWSDVLRVLKPGAYLAAFGATRGYHRMACAIEDAGFEIRDSLAWMYGTGFPKSHDVSKGIDRAAGVEREVIGKGINYEAKMRHAATHSPDGGVTYLSAPQGPVITAPATAAAQEWQGWGTALKPAFEPIVLARKPLSESTVAANVLRWRTGAINIDACRIGNEVRHAAFTSLAPCHGNALGQAGTAEARRGTQGDPKEYVGRWPANVVHDGSDEVIAAFPITGPSKAASRGLQHSGRHGGLADIGGNIKEGTNTVRGHDDAGGSAARFFYSAKASRQDRNGSKHPTVKPIALMQWLARLITPPGGSVLDPFAGSGTTGAACAAEGFNCVLMEREAEYIADIKRRLLPSAFPWGPPKMPWET